MNWKWLNFSNHLSRFSSFDLNFCFHRHRLFKFRLETFTKYLKKIPAENSRKLETNQPFVPLTYTSLFNSINLNVKIFFINFWRELYFLKIAQPRFIPDEYDMNGLGECSQQALFCWENLNVLKVNSSIFSVGFSLGNLKNRDKISDSSHGNCI